MGKTNKNTCNKYRERCCVKIIYGCIKKKTLKKFASLFLPYLSKKKQVYLVRGRKVQVQCREDLSTLNNYCREGRGSVHALIS